MELFNLGVREVHWDWILLYLLMTGIGAILLRRTHISDTAKALWFLLIVILPVMGFLGFLIINVGFGDPQNRDSSTSEQDENEDT